MGIRIGIIGVGGLGYLQASTYRDIDGISIIAAADVTADARDLFENEFRAPAYDNYRSLLQEHGNELDAVTIVTPHTLHYEQTMACLDAGLHVLVEKPMVTDIEHAVDIVETAAELDRVVQVGYQRRFHPAFQEIRRVVQSGRIGDLHTINCHVGQNWIENHRNTWRVNPELSGGGQLYDTGSHLLDALLWVTDAEPRTVTAQIEYAKPEIDVNSALTIGLANADRRITASVSISGDGVDVVPEEGYFFWGTDGYLAYVDDELVVTESSGVTYRTEITADYDFNVLNERKLQNFIGSIEGTTEPAVPAEDGLEITALTEAAYAAADSQASVEVQPVIQSAFGER